MTSQNLHLPLFSFVQKFHILCTRTWVKKARVLIIPRWAKCFRLTWELNLLLSSFGLSAVHLPTPHPARRPGIALLCTVISLYGHTAVTVRRWRVGCDLTVDALPSPTFSYLGMINLCPSLYPHETFKNLSSVYRCMALYCVSEDVPGFLLMIFFQCLIRQERAGGRSGMGLALCCLESRQCGLDIRPHNQESSSFWSLYTL